MKVSAGVPSYRCPAKGCYHRWSKHSNGKGCGLCRCKANPPESMRSGGDGISVQALVVSHPADPHDRQRGDGDEDGDHLGRHCGVPSHSGRGRRPNGAAGRNGLRPLLPRQRAFSSLPMDQRWR